MSASAAEKILAHIRPLLYLDPPEIGTKHAIPKFASHLVASLLSECNALQRGKPPLLRLHGNFIVVGDLHGDLHDLLRVIQAFGMPPIARYLFLGDYSDRGAFSLEVCTVLYAMRLQYPEHVFLLRGNHEFPSAIGPGTLNGDIQATYGQTWLWDQFQYVFSFLPYAAVINDRCFCVHGGISGALKRVDDILSIQLPMPSCSTQLVNDLVWSDPCAKVDTFGPSERGGAARVFGRQAVEEFLSENGLQMIIRGHERVPEGIRYVFDKKVVTVSSSSNYSRGSEQCTTGALLVTVDGHVIERMFTRVVELKREDALFGDVDDTGAPQPRNDAVGHIIMKSVMGKQSARGGNKPALFRGQLTGGMSARPEAWPKLRLLKPRLRPNRQTPP